MVKVLPGDVLFIEGLDDYIKIHQKDQKPLVTRMTIKALEEKPPKSEFIRVHRAYIVPFKIEAVRNKVLSTAGEEISTGSGYAEHFFSRFIN